jgi:hypothetical protein
MRLARRALVWTGERLRWSEDRHGDAGTVDKAIFGGVLLGTSIAVMVTLLLSGPKQVNRTASAEGGVPAPTRAPASLVAPAMYGQSPPPAANPQCVQDVLAKHYPTLKWNGFSWVDTADKAPLADSPEVPAWRGRMAVKVEAVTALFSERQCDKPPAELPTPKPVTPQSPTQGLEGKYELKATGAVQFECRDSLPKSLTVHKFQSTTEFDMSLEPKVADSPGGSFVVTMNSGLSWRLDVPQKYFTMTGTFITRSSENIIEGGLIVNVGGGCQIEYEGTKARSP